MSLPTRKTIDPTTYRILVMFAEVQRYFKPNANEFDFTKKAFLYHYNRMRRQKLVEWVKYETITRNLRAYAKNKLCLKYLDDKGGRYIGIISCLEDHKPYDYKRIREELEEYIDYVIESKKSFLEKIKRMYEEVKA